MAASAWPKPLGSLSLLPENHLYHHTQQGVYSLPTAPGSWQHAGARLYQQRPPPVFYEKPPGYYGDQSGFCVGGVGYNATQDAVHRASRCLLAGTGQRFVASHEMLHLVSREALRRYVANHGAEVRQPASPAGQPD